MVTLTERTIMKSRSGVYSDTAENRRKHRVGQKYGAEKQSDDGEKTEKKETDPAKELEAVNKVIAAINEGKMNLPAAEVIKLSEKKQKLEAAKKQAEKINSGVKANEEKKNAEEAKETSKKINEAQKKERIQSLDSELEQLEEKREKALRDRFYISSKDEEGEELNRKEINDLSDKIDKLRKEKAKLESKKKKEESSSKKSAEMDSGEKTDSPKEKEKKADEKNSKKAAEMKEKMKSDKASDPIYQIQQKKKEAAKKYDDKREKARQKFDKESDEIRSQIDKLYESDHPDAAKKRKELWNSLKEKTNKYDEETTKLKNEYEAEYQKLDEAEDKLYDQRHKEETSQESSDTDKEELDEDGELVTITHDKDKFERYRLFRDLYAARMKRGTSPNLSKMGYLKNSGDINKKGNEKYYELQKEFGNKKYAFKEKIQEEKPKEDSKESYTRVKFDDVPNSEKINLKKYLSDKVRKGVDEKWSSIKKIPTENLKKMEKGLVNDLNKNFEAIKKSQRAELLYSIMKVRGELESRGKETQKKE